MHWEPKHNNEAQVLQKIVSTLASLSAVVCFIWTPEHTLPAVLWKLSNKVSITYVYPKASCGELVDQTIELTSLISLL